MDLNEEIRKALATDGLAEAEKATGKSYKEDRATQLLGLLEHAANVGRQQALLEVAGDTTMSDTIDRYLGIVTGLGFDVVYREPFHSDRWNHDDELWVLFHPDGILLYFDTFRGDVVNSGKYQYCWKPNPGGWPCGVVSSGACSETPEGTVWNGDHDCREAVKFHIGQLRDHGTFLNPWRGRSWGLRLCHYEDWKGGGYSRERDKLNRKKSDERIAKLPEHVRRCIQGV